MRTTMCSIWGIVSLPGGSCGKGRVPGVARGLAALAEVPPPPPQPPRTATVPAAAAAPRNRRRARRTDDPRPPWVSARPQTHGDGAAAAGGAPRNRRRERRTDDTRPQWVSAGPQTSGDEAPSTEANTRQDRWRSLRTSHRYRLAPLNAASAASWPMEVETVG